MTTTYADERSQAYIRSNFTGETDVLRELREYTTGRPDSFLQITPDQGAVIKMLVSAVGARKVIEIGVYTGYSAIWMASALPDDGDLVACDIDPDAMAVAQCFFVKARVRHKITVRLGDALATIGELLAAGGAGTFDFAFIDADKEPMEAYYEGCLSLLRPGGLIVVDNVLWEGKVADPEARDPNADAMRAILLKAVADRRVETCVLPVGDGLLVVRKPDATRALSVAKSELWSAST